ncbi:MAG: extracellular solute-binding protein [Thermoanaerobaculia bacterium]|nr:extracellular solute-binding protein [Thermoanaerobaculia bacterium]
MSARRSASPSASRFVRPLALALALTAASCTGDGRTPLVVYSPHGRDLLQLFEAEFERARPGIDFRFLDMGSQEVYDRIRSERANPQADVWFGGPDAIFARAAAEGLLAPLRPAWAEAVPEASRAPGDFYFGTYRTLPVVVWNSAAVDAAAAPADWEDLLAPRFAGRLLVRDPMASGVMRTFFGYVLARAEADTGSTDAGWAWLARLDAATRDYVANPALLFEKLARGEGDVTVWELTDVLLHRAAGDSLGFALPASGTPVIDDSVALVAGAPHAAAAAEFLDWVGSLEAQSLAAERAFRLPARQDLTADRLPEWAREVLAQLVVADYDADRAAAQGPAWMSRWDEQVRGRGAAAAGVLAP